MPDSAAFEAWLARLRARDRAAADELIRTHAPILRRVVRARLARLRLSRLIDAHDVTQAVFSSFFSRLTDVWPEANSAEHLTALLVTIARNRIQDEVRRQTAGRRDHRRVLHCWSSERLASFEGRDPAPAHALTENELYQQAISHLSADEQSLLTERLAGRDWETIAAARGASAQGLRKQFARAVQRVRRKLLDDTPGPLK